MVDTTTQRSMTEHGADQAKPTLRQTIETEGGRLLEEVKALLHEGNVSRIVVRQGEQVIAEFPLSVGVVGTLLAPVLAALGALAALLSHCTIEIERAEPAPTAEQEPAATVPEMEQPIAATAAA